MRALAGVLGAMIAVALCGCTSVDGVVTQDYDFAQVKYVAVVDVVGQLRGGEAQRNEVADFFDMELMRRGYQPIERAQVKSLLREHEFQTSDLTREEGAATVGQILNADAVLIVNIPYFGCETALTAKMLDVEDGRKIWVSTGNTRTFKWVITLGGALAGAGAGYALGGDTTGKRVGAVLGGLVGGLAGYALSPRERRLLKGMIGRMCETLPARSAAPAPAPAPSEP